MKIAWGLAILLMVVLCSAACLPSRPEEPQTQIVAIANDRIQLVAESSVDHNAVYILCIDGYKFVAIDVVRGAGLTQMFVPGGGGVGTFVPARCE